MNGAARAVVAAAMANRLTVLGLTAAFAVLGVVAFGSMVFDAFPDITGVQVQVLTTALGMGPEEVEQLVTVPVERVMGGIPRMRGMRSVSSTGVSAVTVLFDDGASLWQARQLVKERIDDARGVVPAGAVPGLGPPTTGLGEVFQFVVESDRHTIEDVYRLFERDIAPRLRLVPGVVEVNAWGGGAPTLWVEVDPFRLAARGLTLDAVHAAVGASVGVSAGGARVDGAEQRVVRGIANPDDEFALADLVIRPGTGGGPPVRVGDVAAVRRAPALTVGAGTFDGRGEAVYAVVQMLAGADALSVVRAVRDRLETVKRSLPEGVTVHTVYDREVLVSSVLATVARSLSEGALLVIFVHLLTLGDIISGLVTASVIALSLLGAFIGLWLTGLTGNLMSLGAVDFGLVVDGTVVVMESVLAARVLTRAQLRTETLERTAAVAPPVLFAVGILILVYIPVVTMVGTEGKLFRPMAATVLFALATALVLSFTYVPVMASLVFPVGAHGETWFMRRARALYERTLPAVTARPRTASAVTVTLIITAGAALAGRGVEFVPRLEEGDLVVQSLRPASIARERAVVEAGRIERLLLGVPEVTAVASRSGSPAVATDPMGMEEADIYVRLKPRGEWTTARNREDLMAVLAERLHAGAPGAVFAFTQPIEMRFNELMQGITTDVGVKVYGPDTATLYRLGEQVAAVMADVPGAADVVAPAPEGVPVLEIVPDPEAAARAGVTADTLLTVAAAVQRGRRVAEVMRAGFRDAVVVRLAPDPGLDTADIPVVTPAGVPVPLFALADVRARSTPARVSREAGSRRVIVKANVRGRDLGGFVEAARAAVEARVPLPAGYWMEWGGTYEQWLHASRRTAVTVPLVLALVLGVLTAAFGALRPALVILLNVPAAWVGGTAALVAAGMPVSMSAVVGFIALSGVAVMNGVVLVARIRELHAELGDGPAAARAGAFERLRPVLTTALAAGIGFLPPGAAAGVGAEVQRPLAVVVIGGLVTATLLTLYAVPTVYARLCPHPPHRPAV